MGKLAIVQLHPSVSFRRMGAASFNVPYDGEFGPYEVVAAVLADPVPHLGMIYELTGSLSQDMDGVAREFSEALNRQVTYSDVSPEK
jgi:hypothetical protein